MTWSSSAPAARVPLIASSSATSLSCAGPVECPRLGDPPAPELPGLILAQALGARLGFVAPLTIQEQPTSKSLRRGSQPSPDFFVKLTLAAILAALGLLMSTPR